MDKKEDSSTTSVALLLTGSELMSGDIVDSNSAMLAKILTDAGIEIQEKCTLADNKALIAYAIERLSQSHDCLIINGGLGPTCDDLTSEILAGVCASPLQINLKAEQHVYDWCADRGTEVNQANLKQALLPECATLLDNAPGSASAYFLFYNHCLILATPGVPSELSTIMIGEGLELLKRNLKTNASNPWQRFTLFGIGESRLQEVFDHKLKDLNRYYHIGFRSGVPFLELKLKAKTDAVDTDSTVIKKALTMLTPYILGDGNTNMAQVVVDLLKEKGKTISFAESCTGGLITSKITKVPGCSDVFPGAVVSYSNTVKNQLLGVDKVLLDKFGAVSKEVVDAMLQGVLTRMNTDFSIAVTGIAGPDGGSDSKPLGTVWIAWGGLDYFKSTKLVIALPRPQFQAMVSTIALDLIRRQLLGLDEEEITRRWQ